MIDNLTSYERHRPCRKPWRDDDPVGVTGLTF
jgi:hypothetical protein